MSQTKLLKKKNNNDGDADNVNTSSGPKMKKKIKNLKMEYRQRLNGAREIILKGCCNPREG